MKAKWRLIQWAYRSRCQFEQFWSGDFRLELQPWPYQVTFNPHWQIHFWTIGWSLFLLMLTLFCLKPPRWGLSHLVQLATLLTLCTRSSSSVIIITLCTQTLSMVDSMLTAPQLAIVATVTALNPCHENTYFSIFGKCWWYDIFLDVSIGITRVFSLHTDVKYISMPV